MAIDERAEQPEAKPTVRMSEVPIWAIELTKNVKEGIAELKADVQLVSNDLGIVKDRVLILEREREKHSGGVRNLSVSDAAQSQEISNLAERFGKLEKTADASHEMLKTVTGLMDKPLVRRLGYATAGLMLAALTTATGYLARGNVAAAQPTIIQVAPAAALTDGGTR
jgi:hypothetical protein